MRFVRPCLVAASLGIALAACSVSPGVPAVEVALTCTPAAIDVNATSSLELKIAKSQLVSMFTVKSWVVDSGRGNGTFANMAVTVIPDSESQTTLSNTFTGTQNGLANIVVNYEYKEAGTAWHADGTAECNVTVGKV